MSFATWEKLTEADYRRIFEAEQNGATITEICKILKINRDIWYRIRSAYAPFKAKFRRELRKRRFQQERADFIQKMKEDAVRYSALGFSKEEIARMINLRGRTLDELMEEDSIFKHQFDVAPLKADGDVIVALRKRANGYQYVTETETEIFDRNGNSIGKTKVKSKKVALPSLKAHELWLVNRRKWRLNTEEIVDNPDGTKIEYDIREKMLDEFDEKAESEDSED